MSVFRLTLLKVAGAALALMSEGVAVAGASQPPALAASDIDLAALCPEVALGDTAFRVWRAPKQVSFSPDLKAALARAGAALLGEIHDNAAHHKIQACLLSVFASGRKPAVVWEQISGSQSADLQAYWARSGRSATGLGAAIGWDKSGWPRLGDISANCRCGAVPRSANDCWECRSPACHGFCGGKVRRRSAWSRREGSV